MEEVRSDGEKAFCKVCRAEIRAHRADLVKHSTSAKHKQNIAKISGGQKSIKSIFCKKEDKISKFEIRLSRVKYQLPDALLITGYSLIHAPLQLVNESELRHGLSAIR